jgi:hypothetical protein
MNWLATFRAEPRRRGARATLGGPQATVSRRADTGIGPSMISPGPRAPCAALACACCACSVRGSDATALVFWPDFCRGSRETGACAIASLPPPAAGRCCAARSGNDRVEGRVHRTPCSAIVPRAGLAIRCVVTRVGTQPYDDSPMARDGSAVGMGISTFSMYPQSRFW